MLRGVITAAALSGLAACASTPQEAAIRPSPGGFSSLTEINPRALEARQVDIGAIESELSLAGSLLSDLQALIGARGETFQMYPGMTAYNYRLVDVSTGQEYFLMLRVDDSGIIQNSTLSPL